MDSFDTFERALGRRNTRTSFEEIQGALGPIPLGPVVGGKPLDGDGVIAVVDPATEEVITEIANGTVAEATAAVDVARQAQDAWAEASPRARSEVLRRAFDLMTQRAEALARLTVLENGKALPDARSEVAYAAEFFRWYAEEAVRLGGVIEHAPAGTNKIMVLRQPIGVSLLITPWNFPAAMATRKIGPALAAGCSVILKPASETPLTALAIVAILAEAGVPDGVVNVVPSTRSNDLSSALLDHPLVRKVSFTGSTEVGRVLLEHASRTVVSAAMELGGNAPFLVLPDADLDEAVAGALVAKLRNGGSACTAANRFIVHASLADAFTRRFAEAVASLPVGPGLDEATRIGPLVNAKTRDKVADLVQSALDAGATPLTGGSAPDRAGYYYTPTVLGGVHARPAQRPARRRAARQRHGRPQPARGLRPPPPPSAAPSSRASAARVGTRAWSSSRRASTSPWSGDAISIPSNRSSVHHLSTVNILPRPLGAPMNPYVHVPAAKILGELEPNGHRAGFDSGDPRTAILTFDTEVKTGVWECQPGGWQSTREDTEVCYILSGRATITDGDTGTVYDVSAGDVIVQPKGWSGRWDVTETIRKVYCHGFD